MIGLILAGGYGRRMGREKVQLEIEGVPLYMRVAQTLKNAGVSPHLSLRSDQTPPADFTLPVIRDFEDGKGPLQAILAALQTSGRDVLVVPCDLPNLNEQHLVKLMDAFQDESDVVHFSQEGELHFFPSIWSKQLINAIAQHIQTDLSIRRFIKDLRVRTIPLSESGEPLINLNTPEDLEKWKKQ